MGDTASAADLSFSMRKLYEEKTKQREAAREYFRKYCENPFRQLSDSGPFDPAVHRYSAMRMYHYEYIKPCAKSYLRVLYVITPMLLLHFFSQRERKQKNKVISSGLIAYKDRENKFDM